MKWVCAQVHGFKELLSFLQSVFVEDLGGNRGGKPALLSTKYLYIYWRRINYNQCLWTFKTGSYLWRKPAQVHAVNVKPLDQIRSPFLPSWILWLFMSGVSSGPAAAKFWPNYLTYNLPSTNEYQTVRMNNERVLTMDILNLLWLTIILAN